jgi:NAD(P)H-nitrite reductase large subunit
LIEFDQLIVATGAREFTFPFPGWTLPGVMGLGGFQMLLKNKAIHTKDRVVIAGSSPLLLKVAFEAVNIGIKPEQVNLTGSIGSYLPIWLMLGLFPGKVSEGLRYLYGLLHAGIPVRFNRTVVEATGDTRLRAIKVAPLPNAERGQRAKGRKLPLEILAVGNGFVPNIELTELLGCTHTFAAEFGGWAVQVNGTMETSVSGVFAAGETVGIAGAACAFVEGELAGIAVAHKLDRLSPVEFQSEVRRLAKKRTKERRFGRIITRMKNPAQGAIAWRNPELCICRCQDVTLKEVREAVAAGARELDELKNWLRIGQGYCQGRTCEPLLLELLVQELGHSPERLGRFRPRPPIKPVQLAELSGEPIEI